MLKPDWKCASQNDDSSLNWNWEWERAGERAGERASERHGGQTNESEQVREQFIAKHTHRAHQSANLFVASILRSFARIRFLSQARLRSKQEHKKPQFCCFLLFYMMLGVPPSLSVAIFLVLFIRDAVFSFKFSLFSLPSLRFFVFKLQSISVCQFLKAIHCLFRFGFTIKYSTRIVCVLRRSVFGFRSTNRTSSAKKISNKHMQHMQLA